MWERRGRERWGRVESREGSSLVPRPFWEGEMAWQLPRVQTVYGRNVKAIAYLIQAVKSTGSSDIFTG